MTPALAASASSSSFSRSSSICFLISESFLDSLSAACCRFHRSSWFWIRPGCHVFLLRKVRPPPILTPGAQLEHREHRGWIRGLRGAPKQAYINKERTYVCIRVYMVGLKLISPLQTCLLTSTWCTSQVQGSINHTTALSPGTLLSELHFNQQPNLHRVLRSPFITYNPSLSWQTSEQVLHLLLLSTGRPRAAAQLVEVEQ